MRHVAHKGILRQVTNISYLPIIQAKLYIFRQQNDRKKLAILAFEK